MLKEQLDRVRSRLTRSFHWPIIGLLVNQRRLGFGRFQVKRPFGKGEVVSSILTGSTIFVDFVVTLGCILILFASAAAEVSRPKVVAAQNFYGDVARQIGGAWFEVLSIMSCPDQDPHLFEATQPSRGNSPKRK